MQPINYLYSKIRDKHALWYKVIVFVTTVLLCAYLLPQHITKTIDVSVGDIWKDKDLISNIDFLVKKTRFDIGKEKEQQLEQAKLYFTKTAINTIELVDLIAKNATTKEYTQLKQALDSIYNIGLYYSFLNLPTHSDSIFIVDKNEAYGFLFSKLLTENTARNYLEKTILNKSLLEEVLVNLPANIEYNTDFNKDILQTSNTIAVGFKSKVNKGDVILHKNEVITEEHVQLLKNYNEEIKQASRSNTIVLLGNLCVSLVVLSIMLLFLAFFRKQIFSQNVHVTFVFMLIALFMVVAHFVSITNPHYFFAIPFCLIPILIRVFFDSRTALFCFLNIILLSAFFTTDKFEFIFIELVAGIGTIFSVADMSKRSRLVTASFLSFFFYVIAFIGYHLINDTFIVLERSQNYYPFLISSLCVLFAFPFIFLFEKIFGFISDFTLLELCDLNSPLLRELSQKVPGTFQHSLQVANLAEEACFKIGGNALLVRTGAMYHDIGKIEHPRFFIENQVGEVSPHSELTPEESAKIIINHVINGIEIAKENKLPEIIIDFIRTHHGTTATRYFLFHYKKKHEGEVINENLFRYPGPIPFSKETAILMMADGVEAASRSLKTYDAVSIDDLVDNVINHQINEQQFMNADITFRDIHQIKKIFKKRLMNIYHVRIEYPR